MSKNTPAKKKSSDKSEAGYCACCGAKFIEGKGWVEPHKFPCANDRYGWAFTLPHRPKRSE